MNSRPTGNNEAIHVILTSLSERDAILTACGGRGASVLLHPSPTAAARAYDPESVTCAFVDARLPGDGALRFLHEAAATSFRSPVVVAAVPPDISFAAELTRAGAFDLLPPGVPPKMVWQAARRALDRDATARGQRLQAREWSRRLEALTPREVEVLSLLSHGLTNREVGLALRISPKTVEVHRGRVMQKLGAESMTALVRDLLLAGLDPAGAVPTPPGRSSGGRARHQKIV